MRIGIDGAFALGTEDRRGMAEEVVERVATDYPGSEILVYIPKVNRKRRSRMIDELHNVEYRLPAPSGFQGRMWGLFGITNCLQPDKIDVYHGLNGDLPLNIAAAHVPTVVSVGEEEMEVLKGRGWWPMKQLRQYVAIESLRNATRVIAGSEEIKRTITDGYGIACDKIDVIPSYELSGVTLMDVYERAVDYYRR